MKILLTTLFVFCGLFTASHAHAVTYSFTMTAGEVSGIQGYVSGDVLGSIDAEPIPGEQLNSTLYDATSGVIGFNGAIDFTGDLTALLTTQTVWVDGVEYAANFSGWSFNESNTGGTWSANAPVFVNGNEYFIEIKSETPIRPFRLFGGMSFKLYSGKFVLYAPAGAQAPEDPEPEGYSFTMTAGVYLDALIGYISGNEICDGNSNTGSIDVEPILGETMEGLYYISASQQGIIAFAGDITSILSGLQVYVDSVLFPFDFDWDFDGSCTSAIWDVGNAPVFVDTEEYFVEIK